MNKLLVFLSLMLLTAGSAAAATRTVDIRNFKFNPTPLRIHVGDSVTFVNHDNEAHTATAYDKSFDSQGLDSNDKWTHVFRKPGTYRYFCQLHPYMKAIIIVLPSKM
ncbi:MAG TPA: cupredoxin family copper-binding protein [Candidatus Rubrimentiphilum sp.]|nr:cupredoxin family copper-binding protein [Candidatus Rubrimentiphilum sp.]